MDDRISEFVSACGAVASTTDEPGFCVAEIAPMMMGLAAAGADLLTADQQRDDPLSYARNAVHLGGPGDISLFALVWRPGQWTPIHDHGTWGVVGVLQGMLEERAFLPTPESVGQEANIKLQEGGIVLLSAGSVSTFVPNPDHIHVTGVPDTREPAISLHLYGRALNSFHIYNRAAGTRRLVDVAHFDSR